MSIIFWTLIGFLSGSIPFSYLIVRFFLSLDVRDYNDGNPGAGNAWKLGGWPLGLPATILDFSKGAVPVGLAYYMYGVSGWSLVLPALSPIFGHAFTPFLGFRGGKSVAVTFGVWSSLTMIKGSLAFGIFTGVFYLFQTVDSWSIISGFFCFLPYLLFQQEGNHILAIWSGNMIIFIWRYRFELKQKMQTRPFLQNIFRRVY